MTGGPVLELAGAGRTYPGTPPVVALADVNVAIGPGEMAAIVGPSGSGKSTLLHLMGTLDRPTAGTVRVAGHDVRALSDAALSGLRARHVGFVFQQFFLVDGMSARDNVANGLLYRGLSGRRRRQVADQVLERVGLASRAAHPPQKLSGGERQRVAIARAIVGRPSVVLADEPTGNLDQETGRRTLDLLESLNREDGTTIVVITHDPMVASRMPRRIDLLDGRVVRDSVTSVPDPVPMPRHVPAPQPWTGKPS